MDFERAIDDILKDIPKERRTYLFSATMTKKVSFAVVDFLFFFAENLNCDKVLFLCVNICA